MSITINLCMIKLLNFPLLVRIDVLPTKNSLSFLLVLVVQVTSHNFHILFHCKILLLLVRRWRNLHRLKVLRRHRRLHIEALSGCKIRFVWPMQDHSLRKPTTMRCLEKIHRNQWLVSSRGMARKTTKLLSRNPHINDRNTIVYTASYVKIIKKYFVVSTNFEDIKIVNTNRR